MKSTSRSIWIQCGIQCTKKEQNNNECVQNWSEIINEGRSTVWSGAKYNHSLILFLWPLLPFLSLHYIFFFLFSDCTMTHVKQLLLGKGFRSYLPFILNVDFRKKNSQQTGETKQMQDKNRSFIPSTQRYGHWMSQPCMQSLQRHFTCMCSRSHSLHQWAQEISLVWISLKIWSYHGSSSISLGSRLPFYYYFAKNEPIPYPICIFRTCSAFLRPLPNNSDKHTSLLEHLCLSWLMVEHL